MRRAVNIVITIIISLGFLLLGYFVFFSSYLRFWETLVEFGESIAFYFCEIFGIEHNIMPSVNNPSEVVGNMIKLPDNIDGFKENTQSFFSLFVSGENFVGWWGTVTGTLETLSKVLVLLLPCLVGLWFVIKWLYGRSNTRHNKDTVPLIVFKFISKCTYQPFKRFLFGYMDFLREHGWIWQCWVALWVFHFNLASIIAGFLAYYFYFAVSFDLTTVYPQICRLFIDVQIPFRYFPYWSLLFVAWRLFQRWRRRIALSRLRHYEARNCGFINELPIVSITCGSMGKKKTTAITDMALSQEVMFRQSAPPLDDALLPLEKIAVTGELPIEEETEQPANILQPNERRMTKKELFNELYQEYAFLKKRERKEKLIAALRPYFKTDVATKTFVESNLERKTRNLIARRIRLTRKVNLQDFNYFVTFTYNGEIHTEETFRKTLKNCLKLLSSRKGWKYVGVWERSPEKQRLHFHGLFFIPEGTMPGILFTQRDYSFKTHRMQETTQNTYFNQRFGRSDFEKLESGEKLGDAMGYLMKYIEKTGEKIVYSRGLPQYFISDVIEDDVVTKTGMEDKKLLLFDNFGCWDEGEYLGAVSKDVIGQMRKAN